MQKGVLKILKGLQIRSRLAQTTPQALNFCDKGLKTPPLTSSKATRIEKSLNGRYFEGLELKSG
ncbi:hypothetical protein BTM418_04270 [Helicobacter pylori]